MDGIPLLLQIANVCTLCGGPGALCWTITRALENWRHAILFLNSGTGAVPRSLAADFGCPVVKDPNGIDAMISAHRPAVILFHNSAAQYIRADPHRISVYYQHSAFAGAKSARSLCDVSWTVSHYLARAVGLPEDAVIYQPVPKPPHPIRRQPDKFLVGRLCTPNARKWIPSEQLPLYSQLAREHADVEWEFVGCPPELQRELQECCRGRARFFPAEWAARQYLWRWHVLLFHASQLETYGRTICEAQRAGCVPIVDDQGGFREQIEDRSTGRLCRYANDFSLALEELKRPATFGRMSPACVAAGTARGDLPAWAATFERTIGLP